MAIIQCPSCGGNVSDKAEACPHCASSISVCPECKSILSQEFSICPSCGFPISPQTNNKNKTKKKFHFIPLVVILSILLVSCVVVFSYFRNSAYHDNLLQATYTILDGSTVAEEAGDFITDVWYAAIHDEPTTKTATYLVDAEDFNEALNNLFTSSMFKEKIAAIIDNQYDVSDLMKSLLDPPSKYQEAYVSIKKLYEDYLTLTNLSIAPEGSYNTYSESLTKAITNFFNSYKAMELYLDP